MAEMEARRLTLLYELYLASQASRGFMRQALAGGGIGSEEFAIYSYFKANGPRTVSQAARDLGMPMTTLATMLGARSDAGEFRRRPHPRDRRAQLVELTDAGRRRWASAVPTFSAAYADLLEGFDEEGVDAESLFVALAHLRAGLERSTARLEDVERAG